MAFDAQALSQVVLNLLDNAIKYAAGYEPQAVDVEVTIDDLGKNALLTVADQGPGIPDSERERVFERFYRVEAAEQQHAPGTGIGLALVRELVRAHGGSVSAKNARGRSQDSDAPGCMIEVSLPLAHVE